ncbi:MAG: purine-nucleoside phosphorylase [Ignavibacteria bacterium]|nr:purine-nucleoside phosphorylase [Ignavibacteria bacterium]
MTEQKEKIIQSASYIRARTLKKLKVTSAIWTYRGAGFLKQLRVNSSVRFSDIPPVSESGNYPEGDFMLVSAGERKIFVLNGFINFYDGFSMKECAHYIYVLKELGVKKVLLIDEVGYLNPRFKLGGLALIYDQINLMGDNPLIGENDETLGVRFPDMSNCYDDELYNYTAAVFRRKMIEVFPSVYIGVTGPETETEAECRFYREAGADVLGYSLVPLVIASSHAGLKVSALGIMTRELVADRLKEISEKEKSANRLKGEKLLNNVIKQII